MMLQFSVLFMMMIRGRLAKIERVFALVKEEEKGKEEGRKERRERKGKREISPFLI